jgi:hypothetical protein
MNKVYVTEQEIKNQHECPFCGGYCESDFEESKFNFCYGCNRKFNPNNYDYIIVGDDKRSWGEHNAKVLTVKQYAVQCGVSTKTVWAWIKADKLQAQKHGRDWMIPADTEKPKDKRYVENPIRNRRKEPK